jgi:hypothetical protein
MNCDRATSSLKHMANTGDMEKSLATALDLQTPPVNGARFLL